MRRGNWRAFIPLGVAATVIVIVIGCQPTRDHSAGPLKTPPTTLTLDHHPPPRTPEN